MKKMIKVGILDDHIIISDGFRYRLEQDDNISVVASVQFAEELMPMLESNQIDVLILDIGVPVSKTNNNRYPIIKYVEDIKRDYPKILILVISMYSQASMIKGLMKAGASGYIVKDDSENIHNLNNIVTAISTGGVFFSQDTYELINPENVRKKTPDLSGKMMNVLSLAAAHPEYKMEEIAGILNMAPSTVRNTFSRAYARLDVNNRSAAVAKAQQLGILPPPIDNPAL